MKGHVSRTVVYALAVTALSGGWLLMDALGPSNSLAAEAACEFDVCSEESGNCFASDVVAYDCDERALTEGCAHTPCGA